MATNFEGFFSGLENTKPYLKAAFEGQAGSGKTYTATTLAIGLHRRIGSTKPIVFFDTERAIKFLRPLFDAAGIEVLVRQSRTLADLKKTMEFMRSGASDILIIDSISHIWEDALESYKRRVGRQRLEFQDWGIIKPLWKSEFSDPFVNDAYHVIMCGRVGFEYENEKDPDTGRRSIVKVGVKMKVEGETAYEPDILVLMERFEEVLASNKSVWREATVLKDRSTLLDGKTFRNPSYDDFAPSIEAMLCEPVESKSTPENDTANLYVTEEDKAEYRRKKAIALEEIEAEIVRAYPAQTAQAKAAKGDLLAEVFGTRSWTKVTEMTTGALTDYLGVLREKTAAIVQERETQNA